MEFFGKVKERLERGEDYTVKHVEDICGFRYVTLFQNDVPTVIRSVVEALCSSKHAGYSFSNALRVTVHTSRPSQDPLSIRPLIEKSICRLAISNRAKICNTSDGLFIRARDSETANLQMEKSPNSYADRNSIPQWS